MYYKCKCLKQRQKNYKWYGYCTKRRKIVPLFCKECDVVEYKEQKHSNHAQIDKPREKKERFSIIYRDLTKCCNCGSKIGIEKNEVFEGSYRQISIRYGMVCPFCKTCHTQFHNDIMLNLFYKVMFEKEFLKTHSKEEFIKIFGQDYIFKLEQKKKKLTN